MHLGAVQGEGPPDITQGEEIFTGYASDCQSDDADNNDNSANNASGDDGANRASNANDGDGANNADDNDGANNADDNDSANDADDDNNNNGDGDNDGDGDGDNDGDGDGDNNGDGDGNNDGDENGNNDDNTGGDGGVGDKNVCGGDGNNAEAVLTHKISSFGIAERKRRSAAIESAAPQPKRRRLEVPARTRLQGRKNELFFARTGALMKIEKMLNMKESPFHGGHNGQQARRARAIHSYLHMLARNDRQRIDASERAAEAQGFAARWGGRMVRAWAEVWITRGELPPSKRGRHIKTSTLLEDPGVCAELRSYVRSNKWAINPVKLADFTAQKMVPAVAKNYGTNLMKNTIPKGLKQYLELELIPRMHMKVLRGVSIRTARRWLHREGFRFTEHRKALYFDGHERPDVVDYRQNIFVPQMKLHRRRIVEYTVGDVGKERKKVVESYAERRLVLVSHDESTTQANDGKKKSWVHENEHALKKKGVGRGIHQSDVICSTMGWLKDASQSLEYGKNYEGYWNGELFVKQVSQRPIKVLFSNQLQLQEKIIPAFEKAHGPGYQALFMIDNSQGHSAYSKDALLSSRMNLNPGGKQAKMRDGWFLQDGQKVIQPMSFPVDHPQFPGQPKGMKWVLQERGLWISSLKMKCRDKCLVGSIGCCAKKLLEIQPDFREQHSLVQEVIESAGHLCIFLPKFHCELNFIEYFWGAIKKYLRDHCDYTFKTLQENLPKALESVAVETIRKWEHRMWRWLEAYDDGLAAREAQLHVQKFSSRKYKSHRRVPEGLGIQLDI